MMRHLIKLQRSFWPTFTQIMLIKMWQRQRETREQQLDRQDKRMWMWMRMGMRMRMWMWMELRMGWRMPALTCRKWHRWWATSESNSKCEIKVSQKSRNAHLKIINGKAATTSVAAPASLSFLFLLLFPFLFPLLLLQRMPNNPLPLDWRRRWENCANFT